MIEKKHQVSVKAVMSELQQLSEEVAGSDHHLYQPMPSYRMDGYQRTGSKTEGTNHPGGVMVHYYLREKPADSVEVKLAFHELDGTLIKEYSSKATERDEQLRDLKAGGNMFVWDMRYPDAKPFKGMIMWAASLNGPKAVPGLYKVKLTVGDEMQEQQFNILKDPRSESTIEDLQAKFDFLSELLGKVSEAHQTIIDIREIRQQMKPYVERYKDDERMEELVKKAKSIDKAITEIENELYQTKNRSRQDPLNYPIKLTNKLAHLNSLVGRSEFAPTKQSLEVKSELTREIDAQLDRFEQVLESDIPEFNRLVKEKGVDAVVVEKTKADS